MVKVLRSLVCLSALVGAGGFGPAGDTGETHPALKSFAWFSYLDGSSLRRNCAESEADSYRFVYNAVFTEQVRTYDIRLPREGEGPALLRSHVFTYGPLMQTIDSIVGTFEASVWAQRTLPRSAVEPVLAGLAKSGFAPGVPSGQRVSLRSDSFYWLVSACVAGQFRIAAWPEIDARFTKVKFAPPLLALDETAVPVRLPTGEALPPFSAARRDSLPEGDGDGPVFRVELTAQGIDPSWR